MTAPGFTAGMSSDAVAVAPIMEDEAEEICIRALDWVWSQEVVDPGT
jgi:hypothetical protein